MSNNRIIEVERLAQVFAALSNPYRLQIFMRLIAGCQEAGTRDDDAGAQNALGPAPCVGELGQALDIAPSTVSHHLKELRQAGLIQMDRVGQRVECSADRSKLAEIASFFAEGLQD